MKKINRGFTLVELLIVIAIIGILAGVVIASLNTARAKGADAAVKENLHSVRSQSEIYYDNNNGTYLGLCGDQSVINALLSASTTGGAPTTCNDSDTQWAASATLKAAGGFWCADSTGQTLQINTDIGSGVTVCS